MPTTADETGLLRYAKKYNVPRRGAQFATGTITVTSSFATTIADGSSLINQANGARYATVGTTTIGGSLTATANVIALDAGSSSNALSGVSLSFESAPPGINPTATVIAISGGESQWSLIRWGKEIVKRMNAKPAAGNWAHVAALCDTVSGVEQAFIYGALRGTGTLDVVITTPATTGTRTASADILARCAGALLQGAQEEGGDFIAPLAADTFANTGLHAATEQDCTITVGYRASLQNPFAAWPPHGVGYVILDDSDTWYTVTASTSVTSFTITHGGTGTAVAPSVGDEIGVFFESVGFSNGTIRSVTGAGPWVVTVDWSEDATPTETTVPTGRVITPWNTQLPSIAGPPTDESGDGLSGALPDFFARLGPGEMTALTADDTTRRRRYPFVGDVSPFDGDALYPTDITARLGIGGYTDAQNFYITADVTEPTVPDAAFIGTPPSILVLKNVRVIPWIGY